ncbi:MAG: hypothetical protein WC880_02840 [Candidatus Paceibacterota bacterium]
MEKLFKSLAVAASVLGLAGCENSQSSTSQKIETVCSPSLSPYQNAGRIAKVSGTLLGQPPITEIQWKIESCTDKDLKTAESLLAGARTERDLSLLSAIKGMLRAREVGKD